MAVEAFVFQLEAVLQCAQQFRREPHALDGELNLRCLAEKSDVHVAGEVDLISREAFALELDDHRLAHLFHEFLEGVDGEGLAYKLTTARVMVFDAPEEQPHRAKQTGQGRNNRLFNTEFVREICRVHWAVPAECHQHEVPRIASPFS